MKNATHSATLSWRLQEEEKSSTGTSSTRTTGTTPSSARLDPLIEAERTALIACEDNPSSKSLNAIRSASNGVQKEARACVNNYWTDLCRIIEEAADNGNVKGMYD